MYKLVVLAVILTVANAGVLHTVVQPVQHTVVNPAVVTYTAGIKTEAVNAHVPASTTLVKNTPVVHSVVHQPIVTYNAAAYQVPVVHTPVVHTPVAYSAAVPVVTGTKVVTHVSPVEQHGYQVVY